MVLRGLDPRLRQVLDQAAARGHRSLLVIAADGTAARDQVPLLHHVLTKSRLSRPSVLWCYKKDLGFSSAHGQGRKRMKAWKKKIAKHDLEDSGEAFQMFLAATNIRYCYYKETHRILGQTYGMCVLQDFEAVTPNILARTMETVEGGGIIVLLLKTMTSLKQLFTLSMDVHTRFRTEAQQDIIARFNERFLLSLSSNTSCLVMDEDLNILPISSHVNRLSGAKSAPESTSQKEAEEQLNVLKDQFADTQPTGSLLKLCKTQDQAKALLEFIDAITDRNLNRTVSLTAGRGRGKSATMGLAIAAAIGFGYTNVFVTSPSPENVQTLFDFVFKGFDAMEYEEHTDYDIIQSSNPAFQDTVVRINIHEKKHQRQSIQYVQPSDAHLLGQAELLIIDEAGAIPLPLVQKLLGPYLVFLSSTINGYEGTGRSLSLKLLSQLRKQSSATSSMEMSKTPLSRRTLREVELNESIRYRNGDPIEAWLNRLLCLDVNMVQALPTKTLLPEKCELYYINRDTLFSYHKASESFLQRLVSLFVASHYKNTPNDLQMMSDAPAHHLFCLLGPTKAGGSLPEILCAIQVCLEGAISKQSIMHGLSRGKRASGDLIPWTMAQQFQDKEFPALSGARIVRIATHPSFQGMGFGKRAMQLLEQYYGGELMQEDSVDDSQIPKNLTTVSASEEVGLLKETIRPRENLPPLLLRLNERRPEDLDYLGVSFGMTHELLRFWKGRGFVPTYLRQTASDLTGEHTIVMLKSLNSDSGSWLDHFWNDFRKRVSNLMNYDFRKFPSSLALSILMNSSVSTVRPALQDQHLGSVITPYDLRRLELYCNNMADYHLVMDLMPGLARLHMFHKISNECKLSPLQESLLLGIGMQCKSMEEISQEMDLPMSQLLGLFNHLLKKLNRAVTSVMKDSLSAMGK